MTFDSQNKHIEDFVKSVYEKYSKEIFYFLVRCTKDIELAKDLLQDTFIHFIQILKKDAKITESKVRIYIFSIAKNLFINYYRQITKRKFTLLTKDDFLSSEDRTPENEYLKQEEILENEKILNYLLDTLKPEERTLIILRYTLEMKLEDIAEIMDYSTAKISRKMKKIKEKLIHEYKKFRKY